MMKKIIRRVLTYTILFTVIFLTCFTNIAAEEKDFVFTDGFKFKDGSGNSLLDLTFENPLKVFAPGEKIELNAMPYIDCAVVLDAVNAFSKTNVFHKDFKFAKNKSSKIIFSIPVNGVFIISVQLNYKMNGVEKSLSAQMQTAVVNRNKKSEDSFMFGIQAYTARVYYWGESYYGVSSKSELDKRAEILFKYIDYLGVNTVREGGINMLFGQENFNPMQNILNELSRRKILLNWTVSVSETESGWKNSPDSDKYKTFMSGLAKRFAAYDNIIYELSNEPNNPDFGNGSAAEYLKTLNNGIAAVKNQKSAAVIINGGMDTGNERQLNFDGLYYDYVRLTNQKQDSQLKYIAVHNHGDIKTTESDFNNIPGYQSMDKSRLFLNESGYQTKENVSQFEQAKYTAGKLIWAKANKFAGYCAYQLGTDIPRTADEKETVTDFQMVNGRLEPQAAFAAYAAAVNKLDGAVYAGEIDGYSYVFKKGKDSITVTIDGKIPLTADGKTPVKDYEDMFGNTQGTAAGIIYQTKKNEIRADHYPDGGEWTVKSDCWIVANVWVRGKDNDREYKYICPPGIHKFGNDAGGAVWFFASEQEARAEYASNSLPEKQP